MASGACEGQESWGQSDLYSMPAASERWLTQEPHSAWFLLSFTILFWLNRSVSCNFSGEYWYISILSCVWVYLEVGQNAVWLNTVLENIDKLGNMFAL